MLYSVQVAPAELEDLLRSHPGIADAAVIGVPDQRSGEVPKAFIVTKEPKLSEDDVKKFVAEKVSEHKHLVGGVEFVATIPKNPAGKILRRKLKEIYSK
jgi:acyl-coenzyme A synthetase/AMP-(fatty) acid ligase